MSGSPREGGDDLQIVRPRTIRLAEPGLRGRGERDGAEKRAASAGNLHLRADRPRSDVPILKENLVPSFGAIIGLFVGIAQALVLRLRRP